MNKKFAVILICVFVMFLGAESRDELLPDWTAVNYVNSTTAYGHITLDGMDVSEGDLVSAFVDGECRGVQPVALDQGGSFFSIVVNGVQAEQVVFYLFRLENRTIYATENIYLTNPGGTIGYPPDFLEVNAVYEGANILPYVDLPAVIEVTEPASFTWEWGTDIYDLDDYYLSIDYNLSDMIDISLEEPVWEAVTASQSTLLNAEISIDDVPAISGDLVAAFIDDECRGTAVVDDSQGFPYIEMTVYGSEIASVDIHVYSLDEQFTWICKAAFTNDPGGIIGNPQPFAVNANEQIIQSNLVLDILEAPQGDVYIDIAFADAPPVSSVKAEILITNEYINLPPVMDLPLVSFDEDTSFELNLEPYIIDPEGDEIFLETESSPELEVLLEGMDITIIPSPNWFGSSEIEVLAFDYSRFYSLDTLQVDVISVNDLPQILPLPAVTIIEDSSVVISLADYISDEDDESLEVYFSYNPNIDITPSAPSWQAGTGNSWATAYLKVDIPENELGEESVIAAFSNQECIGIADLTFYAGDIYAVLRIYCSELLSVNFKAFESNSGNVYLNNDGLAVMPNTNIGFPPNYYFLELTEQGDSDNFKIKPDIDWFGEVSLSVEVIDDDQATAETELVVIVENIPDPPVITFPERITFTFEQEDWIDLMQYVYEPEMQEVNIEMLESGSLESELDGSILSVYPTESSAGEHLFTFSAEDEDGFVVEESVIVEIVEGISGEKELVNGWNWLSFSWGTNHAQPNDILESIDGSADFLKGQTAFILYNYPVGWLGSIVELDPLQMYRIRLQEDALLNWNGWDISDREISVRTGWNWISYLPHSIMTVNDALEGLGGSGEYIKTQNAYAQYLPGNGWIGPLTHMYPGVGYVLYANDDTVFSYPEVSRTSKQDVEHTYLAASKEHTGSITAEIRGMIPHLGDRLEAYAGEELLGFAGFDNGGIIKLNGSNSQYYFFIYLTSDSDCPELITLQYYNCDDGEVIEFETQIIWKPDLRIGNIQNPVCFEFPEEGSEKGVSSAEINIYPNPIIYGSRHSVNIEIINAEDAIAEVSVYNIKGQLIRKLHSSTNEIHWDLKDKDNEFVSAGIYFLRGKTGSQDITKRFLIIK